MVEISDGGSNHQEIENDRNVRITGEDPQQKIIKNRLLNYRSWFFHPYVFCFIRSQTILTGIVKGSLSTHADVPNTATRHASMPEAWHPDFFPVSLAVHHLQSRNRVCREPATAASQISAG